MSTPYGGNDPQQWGQQDPQGGESRPGTPSGGFPAQGAQSPYGQPEQPTGMYPPPQNPQQPQYGQQPEPQSGGYPVQQPHQSGAYPPPQQYGYGQQSGAYPPQQFPQYGQQPEPQSGGYPVQQPPSGAYPPPSQTGAYPPQQTGAYPPPQQSGAYPPQQFPQYGQQPEPQSGGYPVQQPQYGQQPEPQSGAYPVADPQQQFGQQQPYDFGQQQGQPGQQAGEPSGKKGGKIVWITVAAVVVVVAALGITGFWKPGFFVSKVFDTAKQQQDIQALLTKPPYSMQNVQSVTCPPEQPVTEGKTFDCTVKAGDKEQKVTITVKDSDGKYEVGQPQ
ncbi:DUF4333 domain-containing protein [Amycolatopsis sp. CA-230715]|uniref:DUF4333 domain-containing protein n=1 Tax=Amycolatopsis sp. CA-230715 TaxID=2745196 RepID=UPI001C00D22A|nr:DUF4333 domain-containing protein [Amycolatopsis sp. CA-230715]QWF85433.1 hypothetical protein HUW46_08887 [Amycolatopsis sp. CA-230715]